MQHEPITGTGTGRQAITNAFRLLAAEDGPMADFAKDVVAGAREPRDLLTFGPAADELATLFETVTGVWDSVPLEDREQLIADGPEATQRQLDELAAVDVDAELDQRRAPEGEPPPAPSRPQPDEDDDYFNQPIMRNGYDR